MDSLWQSSCSWMCLVLLELTSKQHSGSSQGGVGGRRAWLRRPSCQTLSQFWPTGQAEEGKVRSCIIRKPQCGGSSEKLVFRKLSYWLFIAGCRAQSSLPRKGSPSTRGTGLVFYTFISFKLTWTLWVHMMTTWVFNGSYNKQPQTYCLKTRQIYYLEATSPK